MTSYFAAVVQTYCRGRSVAIKDEPGWNEVRLFDQGRTSSVILLTIVVLRDHESSSECLSVVFGNSKSVRSLSAAARSYYRHQPCDHD